MIVGQLVSHLEYMKNGTSDDNHNPMFEFCDPQNPNLEYQNMPIALLLTRLWCYMAGGAILSAILDFEQEALLR